MTVNRMKTLLLQVTCGLLFSLQVSGDENAHLSGGSTTVFQDGPNSFAMPLANISRSNRRAHVVGNSFFNKNWVIPPSSTEARDGLGPFFHSRSCSGCHVRDGRGRPPWEGETMVGLLFRLSVPGPDGKPIPDPVFGGQLGVRAVPGVEPEGDVKIEYKEIEGNFGDGTPYVLLEPQYTLLANATYGKPAKNIQLGPRLAQPVYGLGLLEAIPEKSILAHSDPNDKDGDGISGRPNYVWNPEKKAKQLGRFGWKANQPSLRQQTAGAFLGDIGITTSIHPKEDYTPAQAKLLDKLPNGGSPELEDHLLGRVVTYLQTLAPPAQRDYDHPEVLKGRKLFLETGCAKCHLPKLKTGDFPEIPELANQVIRPFTDLLLHDMGPGLADNRPDGEASGTEWRTPPLWGIGLSQVVNGNTRFLHDGRARNLEEAILWHGGEASATQEAYRNLSSQDRQRLLLYLESI
jgi:CxxC motif-containing protein (DUF1111 family)